MRQPNLASGKMLITMPLELKQALYEHSKKTGIPMNSVILQLLWKWYEKGA